MKTNTKQMILAAGAMLIVTSGAMADLTVSGSGGAGWQTFPGALNNYANPNRAYWDQDTMDQAGNPTNRNIGNYIGNTWTGSLPAGAVASPNAKPVWWGKASTPNYEASMDTTVSFNITGPTQVASTMMMELAGLSGSNTLGWYNTSDAAGAETLNIIFAGAASAPAATMFNPSASFGLFLISNGNIYFSESARNRTTGGSPLALADRNTQHFAIFQTNGTPGAEQYIIGVEDLPRSGIGRECVGDYNDMVFTLTAVPTPGAAALLLTGGLVGTRRRRR